MALKKGWGPHLLKLKCSPNNVGGTKRKHSYLLFLFLVHEGQDFCFMALVACICKVSLFSTKYVHKLEFSIWWKWRWHTRTSQKHPHEVNNSGFLQLSHLCGRYPASCSGCYFHLYERKFNTHARRCCPWYVAKGPFQPEREMARCCLQCQATAIIRRQMHIPSLANKSCSLP